jgi:hypothetical protein
MAQIKAPAAKCPGAPADWIWQYVFPGQGLSLDPRGNKMQIHHLSRLTIQRAALRAARLVGI